MLREETVITLGPIVFQNEFCIVRAKTVWEKDKPNKVQVAVHARDLSGRELQPRGYVIGSNMLWFQQRPD